MVHSLILNSVNALISIYLFILFAWWWSKMGKATSVYKATCLLMLGLAIQYLCIASSYYRSVILQEDMGTVVNSWHMATSKYLVTFILIWYAQHVTKKIRKRGGDTTPKRRSTDHD